MLVTGLLPYFVKRNGITNILARQVAAALEGEIVPVNNGSRAAALESGRVDMLIAHMTATPGRAKTSLITNAYGAYDMRFVAAKDTQLTSLDDLAGKRVSADCKGLFFQPH